MNLNSKDTEVWAGVVNNTVSEGFRKPSGVIISINNNLLGVSSRICYNRGESEMALLLNNVVVGTGKL